MEKLSLQDMALKERREKQYEENNKLDEEQAKINASKAELINSNKEATNQAEMNKKAKDNLSLYKQKAIEMLEDETVSSVLKDKFGISSVDGYSTLTPDQKKELDTLDTDHVFSQYAEALEDSKEAREDLRDSVKRRGMAKDNIISDIQQHNPEVTGGTYQKTMENSRDFVINRDKIDETVDDMLVDTKQKLKDFLKDSYVLKKPSVALPNIVKAGDIIKMADLGSYNIFSMKEAYYKKLSEIIKESIDETAKEYPEFENYKNQTLSYLENKYTKQDVLVAEKKVNNIDSSLFIEKIENYANRLKKDAEDIFEKFFNDLRGSSVFGFSGIIKTFNFYGLSPSFNINTDLFKPGLFQGLIPDKKDNVGFEEITEYIKKITDQVNTSKSEYWTNKTHESNFNQRNFIYRMFNGAEKKKLVEGVNDSNEDLNKYQNLNSVLQALLMFSINMKSLFEKEDNKELISTLKLDTLQLQTKSVESLKNDFAKTIDDRLADLKKRNS